MHTCTCNNDPVHTHTHKSDTYYIKLYVQVRISVNKTLSMLVLMANITLYILRHNLHVLTRIQHLALFFHQCDNKHTSNYSKY